MAASNHSFVGINNFNGWNVTMYDSLDTMLLVDLHEEFSAALPIISKEDFRKTVYQVVDPAAISSPVW
ncbi:hypothetical protein L226DRAFT_567412 [Lentinus tigrinus ALCF2SS1-7]|uniref:uncharacterized protein n=1 Tax=Lentinus tigrinus ALCF2SS1-7 TaxID=1328758 RepID=UPI001166115E|nr:hypothetical protein L226DRAFT_567412 [Lentinus tigrinus ALCF2SS1-7]